MSYPTSPIFARKLPDGGATAPILYHRVNFGVSNASDDSGLRYINIRAQALVHEGIYGPRLAGVKDEILAKIYIVP